MVTPLYAASAKTVGALAAILGKNEDATRCVNLAESIRTAYVGSFFNQTTGAIGPGTQASQVFSLYGNMLAAEQRSAALQCLLADIRGPHKQHLSTGIFGTKYLLDVLSREGHSQVAYDLVNQGGFPGWHHMLDRGATTLWEHWQEDDNTYSHNHPMFGSVSQWFFHWLGGIQPASEAVGFDQIMISPQMPKGLDWVKCSYRSVRGNIVCHWRREQHQVTLDLAIPVGVSALVAVPGEDVAHIEENGQPVAQALGVVFVRKDATAAVYRLGSGHYGFTVKRGK